MSFTGTNIQTLVEAEIDDDLDDTDTVQNINACLLEFAEDWRKTSTQTITSDGDSWYARTSGHLTVVKVTEDGEDSGVEYEISHDRSQIRFLTAGTYVVTSLVLPTMLSAIGEAIGVNDIFKLGIARYVAGLFKGKDNERNPNALRMKAEGAGLIARASGVLRSADKRPGKRIAITRSGGDWSRLETMPS